MPDPRTLDDLTLKVLKDAGLITDPDPEYVQQLAGLFVEHVGLGREDAGRAAEWIAPQIQFLVNAVTFAKNECERAERFIGQIGASDVYRQTDQKECPR